MESPEKSVAGRHVAKDSVHVDRLDRLRADGNAAFKAGNLQSAKRHYTAAISLAESLPDEPVEKLVPTRRAQLLANRCQVSLALDKVAEALSDAQAACSSAPGWPKAHYRLGTVHLHRKDYLKAYSAFKQAWHLDVSNQELVKACQDAYELLSGRDRERTARGQLPPHAGAQGGGAKGDGAAASAEGRREVCTPSAASAAIHAAAAEQTEKAARAAQGGKAEGGKGAGSEAEGTRAGTALPAAAPPAAPPPAAPPPAAPPPAAPPPAVAAAPPAQASAAERTPAHSFADAEGGGLLLCVEVPELSSMGAAELEVSGTGFSLYVPQLYRLGPLAWPRPVDVDAARAKFLKKRGVLQVTLPDVCV